MRQRPFFEAELGTCAPQATNTPKTQQKFERRRLKHLPKSVSEAKQNTSREARKIWAPQAANMFGVSGLSDKSSRLGSKAQRGQDIRPPPSPGLCSNKIPRRAHTHVKGPPCWADDGLYSCNMPPTGLAHFSLVSPFLSALVSDAIAPPRATFAAAPQERMPHSSSRLLLLLLLLFPLLLLSSQWHPRAQERHASRPRAPWHPPWLPARCPCRSCACQ